MTKFKGMEWSREGWPPIRLVTGSGSWRLGVEEVEVAEEVEDSEDGGVGGVVASLETSDFELARILVGRRSRAQMLGAGWRGILRGLSISCRDRAARDGPHRVGCGGWAGVAPKIWRAGEIEICAHRGDAVLATFESHGTAPPGSISRTTCSVARRRTPTFSGCSARRRAGADGRDRDSGGRPQCALAARVLPAAGGSAAPIVYEGGPAADRAVVLHAAGGGAPARAEHLS